MAPIVYGEEDGDEDEKTDNDGDVGNDVVGCAGVVLVTLIVMVIMTIMMVPTMKHIGPMMDTIPMLMMNMRRSHPQS